MTNTQISRIHVVSSDEKPAEKMIRLGKENREIMKSRGKAQAAGLMAIHDELCNLTRANEKEQRELLGAYPELMFLATGDSK